MPEEGKRREETHPDMRAGEWCRPSFLCVPLEIGGIVFPVSSLLNRDRGSRGCSSFLKQVGIEIEHGVTELHHHIGSLRLFLTAGFKSRHHWNP